MGTSVDQLHQQPPTTHSKFTVRVSQELAPDYIRIPDSRVGVNSRDFPRSTLRASVWPAVCRCENFESSHTIACGFFDQRSQLSPVFLEGKFGRQYLLPGTFAQFIHLLL